LDLHPERSVLKNFLQQGMDVYMIDWGYPSRKDRYLGIDDHINIYINDIVDFIREREKVPRSTSWGSVWGGRSALFILPCIREKLKT